MALVLRRNQGETIMVGDDIRITAAECSKGFVRLAIAAPKDVSVHRLEIWEEIQDERAKRQAGGEGAEG